MAIPSWAKKTVIEKISGTSESFFIRSHQSCGNKHYSTVTAIPTSDCVKTTASWKYTHSSILIYLCSSQGLCLKLNQMSDIQSYIKFNWSGRRAFKKTLLFSNQSEKSLDSWLKVLDSVIIILSTVLCLPDYRLT